MTETFGFKFQVPSSPFAKGVVTFQVSGSSFKFQVSGFKIGTIRFIWFYVGVEISDLKSQISDLRSQISNLKSQMKLETWNL